MKILWEPWKVYFRSDLLRQTFWSLRDGDLLPVGTHCYSLRAIYEAVTVHELLVELQRDTWEEVPGMLSDGHMLFEIVAEPDPSVVDLGELQWVFFCRWPFVCVFF